MGAYASDNGDNGLGGNVIRSEVEGGEWRLGGGGGEESREDYLIYSQLSIDMVSDPITTYPTYIQIMFR
jgi:hypothetical protein